LPHFGSPSKWDTKQNDAEIGVRANLLARYPYRLQYSPAGLHRAVGNNRRGEAGALKKVVCRHPVAIGNTVYVARLQRINFRLARSLVRCRDLSPAQHLTPETRLGFWAQHYPTWLSSPLRSPRRCRR